MIRKLMWEALDNDWVAQLHAERMGQGKRAASVTGDDVMTGAACMVSVFIREPEFQGQTKEKLASVEAQRLVEASLKDHFDHWLSDDPERARDLLMAGEASFTPGDLFEFDDLPGAPFLRRSIFIFCFLCLGQHFESPYHVSFEYIVL